MAALRIKESPFAMIKVASIPVSKPRERTDYGWETMQVKGGIRVPLADKMADNAKSSMYSYKTRMAEKWDEAHTGQMQTVVNTPEYKALVDSEEYKALEAPAQDKARDKLIKELMGPWYKENGKQPRDFVASQAKGEDGRLVKHKKGGTPFEWVPYTDPDGEPLPKDKRGNETAAFIDIVRIA